MAGHISGTKIFRVEIRGRVPPGVSDELMKANALSSLTVTAALMIWLDNIEVYVDDVAPDAQGGRVRLTQ